MATFISTSSSFFTCTKPNFGSFSSVGMRKNNFLRINAVATKWEPTKVVPQADRVLIRLEEVPQKSAGGVLLPKSAVKFERYLMGEILSVGSEFGEIETGKKVLFSDINAYEISLEKTGPRLEEISLRLPLLEAVVRPIRAQNDALVTVSDLTSDLSGYLSVLTRLEEALRFLADNCGLAIQWLEDIVEYLEDNLVADERYLSNLKNSLKTLREFQTDEAQAVLDGGLLSAALEKLESEFRRLLTEHSVPFPMSSSYGDQA
ncbi:hypothetical protein IFM89_021736 [Coptis chinensis]|uniref:Uncharacterized protein n=1 Tax=Coptis chinensis TaxID=261450 RepID=A0A835J1D0_9MAGN|nr:hypothetical protein IFM89_021736 [Coptis chinensis]